MTRRLALLAALALAGCTRDDVRPYASTSNPGLWQNVVQPADRTRLAALNDAWALALADLDAADQPALASLGPVAARPVADAPLATAPVLLPPGSYQCRLIRLGRRRDAPATAPALVVDAAAPCTVTAGPVPVLATTGATRISGGLYPDRGRLVLLGSLALGDERGWRQYRQDQARAQVGAVTLLGPGHWRLALPWPRWQNKLWLVDIAAAG